VASHGVVPARPVGSELQHVKLNCELNKL
jgi:hypothetical protein